MTTLADQRLVPHATETPAPELDLGVVEAREHAYVAPIVKIFTTEVQLALKPLHYRRTKDNRGPSYANVDLLLHQHAGYLTPRTIDAPALQDLERVLARRAALGA